MPKKISPEKDEDFENNDENLEVFDNVDDDILSDEEIDIIEEIDFETTESELKIDIEEVTTKESFVFSQHTIHKKHSLNYDSIFKGKKEIPLVEEDYDLLTTHNETFEVDKSSIYYYESVDNENYIKEKKLKEKVYEVLSKHTDLNFLNNRRKPSKSDFNYFYYLLKTNLQQEKFSNIEIFNELSVYFSDNLFNMFKLLDNKWRNMIISELQEHIGKQNYSKEVRNKNIHVGTEVEFLHPDPFDIREELLKITGVVIEADYESSTYRIDSYERIYDVELKYITKILNNTKFRYNLNKLNNIDFL
jgi:hypothetical protein